MDEGAPRLVLRQVSCVYGVGQRSSLTAVEDVSLEVYPGELVALLGPSGSGKTTLLNLIAGFVPCTQGEILVNGQPVRAPHPSRTMIFQEHNLFPWKTVLGNVSFGLQAQGTPADQRRRIAQSYIDLVQLTGFENAYPHELSGGMRQRVALARALVLRPACLLMDEPFAALDAQLRSQMQDELLRLVAREQATTLFVTHDIEEAVYLADRVVALSPRPGRVRHTMAIPLARPRTPDIKLTPTFQAYKATLLAALTAS